MWVPQGPGEIPEARTTRETAAAAAPRPAAPTAPRSAAGQPARAVAPATRAAADAGNALGTGYTQATRYGDLLFVSGQIALDLQGGQLKGANAEEQTRQVMENIRTILEAHRLTMANVVATTVYVKDLTGFRAIDEVYESYFKAALPARSVVEVSRLPRGALVEISVVAGR